MLIKMVKEKARPDAVEESLRRRREWTASVIERLQAFGCRVEIVDGAATLSIEEPFPQWVQDYVKQSGLDVVPVIFHAIHEWGSFGETKVFQGEASSIGSWREPFRHAPIFVVGGIRRREDAWEHVLHTKLRRRPRQEARKEADRGRGMERRPHGHQGRGIRQEGAAGRRRVVDGSVRRMTDNRDAEIEKRRAAILFAVAGTEIEGGKLLPETMALFERWANLEIDDELMELILHP